MKTKITMTPVTSHAHCAIVERCVYKTMPEEQNKTWQRSPQANMRSVCITRTTVGQHFNNITSRVGLSAIAELLVLNNHRFSKTLSNHFVCPSN